MQTTDRGMHEGNRYEYREVEFWLFHSGVRSTQSRKRADGTQTSCYLEINDAVAGISFVPDEREENSFVARARRVKLEYLNSLGSDGWRVISYYWKPGSTVEKYLMIREL